MAVDNMNKQSKHVLMIYEKLFAFGYPQKII